MWELFLRSNRHLHLVWRGWTQQSEIPLWQQLQGCRPISLQIHLHTILPEWLWGGVHCCQSTRNEIMLHNNTRSGSYPDFGYILQLLSWGFLSIKERLVCLWKQPSSFHSQECKQWWKHTQWKLYNWRFDPNSIWKLNRKLIISKLNTESTVRKYFIRKLNIEPIIRKLSRCDPTSTSKPNRSQPNRVKWACWVEWRSNCRHRCRVRGPCRSCRRRHRILQQRTSRSLNRHDPQPLFLNYYLGQMNLIHIFYITSSQISKSKIEKGGLRKCSQSYDAFK